MLLQTPDGIDKRHREVAHFIADQLPSLLTADRNTIDKKLLLYAERPLPGVTGMRVSEIERKPDRRT
ncbi:MAG: hypothetical protein C1942_06175 [Prosthecochloris sp.]|nr:hypothetical protein [Prosthecochloris sp.]